MIATRIRAMAQAHWLALFGAVLLSWLVLFLMALPPDFLALDSAGLLAAICGTNPADVGVGGAAMMWALMSFAMMAPTALPAFATYDDLPGTDPAGLMQLFSGYALVWLGFAIVMGVFQVLLFQTELLGTSGQSRSTLMTSGLLAMAGAYQFSPLKEACLRRCRAPLSFFFAHWQEGPFRNGLRLGIDCLGCCWALMLLAFVGGTMSLIFMALAMALMTFEKLPHMGNQITRPLGFGLIGLAAVALIV